MIDISKFDKADVLISLYTNSRPLGMGWLHESSDPMTKEEASNLLREGTYFDYLKGRVMKVDLSGDKLDPGLYDRDNGIGAAEAAINSIGT